MSKTILVTGGNGLLGNAIFRLRKLYPNHKLIATGRGERRPAVPHDIPYYSCDLSSREEVRHLMDLVNPDIVIHGAAMTQVDHCEMQPEDCRRANVEATQFLIEACRPGVRFVLVSTDFVFDGLKGMYSEDDTPNPVSIYGQSKLDAEELVKASGLSYAILRTMLVYGYVPELSRSNIVLWVKASLEKGDRINVVNDQFRCPTLVDNLGEACLLAANTDVQGIYHISSETYLSMYDFALMIADIWNLDASLINKTSSDSLGQPAKRPPKTGFIVDKAKKMLGFVPISVKDGLRILHKRLEVS